ncbi:hypothetical protein [Metabacillus sp. SLBN-84]
MTNRKQEIIRELTDMFHAVQPDEDYLTEDEDTAEEVRDTQRLLDDASVPIEVKIKALTRFNSEWFPDGLSMTEQQTYRQLLDEAEKI